MMLQTAIGQGTSQITPLLMAMVTATIANNGEMMMPYMIDHIETPDGNVIKQYTPKSLGQQITQQEAAALQEMMTAVVAEGTGIRLESQLFGAAGKTGSAEYNKESDSHGRSRLKYKLYNVFSNFFLLISKPILAKAELQDFANDCMMGQWLLQNQQQEKFLQWYPNQILIPIRFKRFGMILLRIQQALYY